MTTTNPFHTTAELLHLTEGRMVATYERIVSSAVWIAREHDLDGGQARPGTITIHIPHQDALNAAGTRRLAAELLAAAELAEGVRGY